MLSPLEYTKLRLHFPSFSLENRARFFDFFRLMLSMKARAFTREMRNRCSSTGDCTRAEAWHMILSLTVHLSPRSMIGSLRLTRFENSAIIEYRLSLRNSTVLAMLSRFQNRSSRFQTTRLLIAFAYLPNGIHHFCRQRFR